MATRDRDDRDRDRDDDDFDRQWSPYTYAPQRPTRQSYGPAGYFGGDQPRMRGQGFGAGGIGGELPPQERGTWSPGYAERGRSQYGGAEVQRDQQPRRTGKPPRAYTRPDDRIRDDVYDRLMAQDWIDCEEIEVTVKDGEVTLTGTTVDRQDKRAIEELADGVLGVKEIHNQLRLRRNNSADKATEPTDSAARSSKPRASS